MGAIIVSIFVSVVACVGGIDFYIEDKRKEKKNKKTLEYENNQCK